MELNRRIVVAALIGVASTTGSCGGGSSVAPNRLPATLDVSVSAGSPVSGAIVTVYAISDATGEVDTSAGAGGVLGTAGPTDSDGNVRVALTTDGYSGPVQIIATGAAMFYVDPAAPRDLSGGDTLVQLPSSFVLSSYVARFSANAPRAPVTFLTTLSDHASRALVRGRVLSHPRPTTITDALAARDTLVVRHITRGQGWDPASFRATVPADLTQGPASLVDSTFAALFDVALNQLAHDTTGRAGFGPGALGLDAASLMEILEQDLDADGRLDGLGPNGEVLQTTGTTPVLVDAQFLRLPLGKALQTWINAGENKSRVRESDLIGAGVFAAMVEDRSDLFGGVPDASADVLLDRTPPVLTWAAPPPVALSARAVSLRINAFDSGTGVKRVLAQNGPAEPVPATLQPDGEWILTLRLTQGPNEVSIWAEDNAPLGSNSGQFAGPPFELQTVIIADASSASVLYNPALASYRDERGMTLATDASGHAVMPPAYVLQGFPVTIPPSGGDVFKAATRLAWSSQPTAALLEDATTGNPDNIPTLQFIVPLVAGVDAPITEATYSVSLSCTGCAIPPATGPLWPSSTTSPSSVLYDLPLSANLIPGLASLSGPAVLTVAVTLADAAGNTSTATPIALTFHVIGPPLATTEDTTYGGRNDPKSTYPYSIATGLYATLFSANTAAFLPENGVRLARFIVENPAPIPVALTAPTVAGSWRIVETWIGDAGIPLGTISYTVTQNRVCSSAPGCGGRLPVSYGGGFAGDGCGASPPHGVTPPTDTPTVASAVLFTFAYTQFLGGDLAPAQRATGGQFIVPAAVGGVPGTLALYVARPLSLAPRTYPLPWLGARFGYVYEDAWVMVSQGAQVCCDFDFEFRKCLQFDAPSTWSGTRFSRNLFSAFDALDGSFGLVTSGVSGTSPVGEAATVPGSISVTRVIPH